MSTGSSGQGKGKLSGQSQLNELESTFQYSIFLNTFQHTIIIMEVGICLAGIKYNTVGTEAV